MKEKSELMYDETYLSLSKLMVSKIKDIVGFLYDPFDNENVIFKLSKVIFENGKSVFIQGEHDIAYIPPDDRIPELSEAVFEKYKEED